MHRLLIVLFVLLGACGERPPRHDPEGEHGYHAEPEPSPLRERTLKQGEPR